MKRHLPKHVGIIPDGNRRWTNGKGMEKQSGYQYGLEPGLKLLQLAKNIGIEEITYYGWQWDLSHIKEDGRPYSHDISRIDLIIRWGGMRRLSGFLPIQSVYADFFVEDHLWPDYTDEDFLQALQWYSRQDITLGG